ncbi:putative uncharacterized protein [Prevotella sp. CAG:1185]|uniref:NAD-dependent epimerase n=1 Tax=uncultured Prevotella sp. TaxID=159272 RepID=UPI000337E6C9|nr:NAD-dependent epimerase [uncultured Prevotella sp.]CCY84940.1 putative uncharacterized protein [Prevotella sp. CAG:1185]
MKILVTGAAGFIGSRCAEMLAERGDEVVGIDNINDYYSPELKYYRLRRAGIEADASLPMGHRTVSSKWPNYTFLRLDIEDKGALDMLFDQVKFDKIIHLAAQAGVRYSIENPYAYMHSNWMGFLNILECCRNFNVEHLVYASSSSVYGMNSKVPFSEDDVVISPVSLYAASKKSNELMAHAYCKLYGIACTGLRYFTVYGPAGRPDMAPMLFARAISGGKPIKVFNNGDMMRDFTYIDDIAGGTLMVLDKTPDRTGTPNGLPYKVYNIGLGSPVNLMDFIAEIENNLGRKAEKIMMPMQPGDVSRTWADTTKLETEIGYKPKVTLHEGIKNFIEWFKDYEHINL